MAQYGFGLGVLALTDSSDTALARTTPLVVGVLQDVSIDISMTVKELRGAYQFPMDVARGTASISGKAKTGQIGTASIAAVLAGSTTSAGMKIASVGAAKTPTTNTFTLTAGASADMPTGGVFYENISVVNESTGVVMTRMPDATTQVSLTAGQYTCSAVGAYAFCTADSNPPVYVTFTYTMSAVGKTVALTNQLMGASTTFTLNLHNNFKSKNYGWRLPSVIVPKLAFAPKQDDYTTMDIEFTAFADSGGNVLSYFGTEQPPR